MRAKLTKSQAVKLALERMFAQEPVSGGVTVAARGFIGSDKTPGNVARNTKRLLRERFRGK
jgi:hypothetical protein